MVKLVKVIENKPGKTTYLADDGETYTLVGDLSTRGNNPGNISPSKKGRQFWIDNFGAIGFAPSSKGQPDVALFPDLESGQRAQAYLWQTGRYQNMTLKDAAATWATDSYGADLIAAAGVDENTLVKDLSPDQMHAVIQTQNAREGSAKLKVIGADGKPVSSSVAQQFGPQGAVRVPSVNVGGNSDVATQIDLNNVVNYKVKAGDTLQKIAKANKTDVATLVDLNGIANPDKISAGATIKLPPNVQTPMLQGMNAGAGANGVKTAPKPRQRPADPVQAYTFMPPPMATMPPTKPKTQQQPLPGAPAKPSPSVNTIVTGLLSAAGNTVKTAPKPVAQPTPAQKSAMNQVQVAPIKAPTVDDTRAEQNASRNQKKPVAPLDLTLKPVTTPQVQQTASATKPLAAPAPLVAPRESSGGGFSFGIDLGGLLDQGKSVIDQGVKTITETTQKAAPAIQKAVTDAAVKEFFVNKDLRTMVIDGGLKKVMNGNPKPVTPGKPVGYGAKGYSEAGLKLKNQFRGKK